MSLIQALTQPSQDNFPHRNLGAIETRMALMHELHNGSTQVSTVIHLEGKINYQTLQKGAENVFALYPTLRSVIKKTENNYQLLAKLNFSEIPRRMLKRESSEHWKKLIDEELNTPLNPEVSLWRFTWLTQVHGTKHELIITRHHAISDANSTRALLNTWLQEIEHATQPPLHGLFLSPPIDQWMFPGPSTPRAAFSHTNESATLQRFDSNTAHAGVHWFDLGATATKDISNLAKKTNLSLHALLSVAFLETAAQMGWGTEFELGTAVSLRDHLVPRDFRASDDCHPCQIGLVNISQPKLTGNWVEKASAYSATLKRKLKTEVNLLPAWSTESLRKQILSLKDKYAVNRLGMTNLGNIDFSPLRQIKIQGYRSCAARLSGSPFLSLHCWVYSGEIQGAFTYTNPILSPLSVEQFTKVFLDNLYAISRAKSE